MRVIDCVDLAAWIDAAPSVGRWLLRQIGHTVDGLRDLDLFLNELDALYGTSLPPELVIGGRDQEFEAIARWFDSQSATLDVEADSTEEAAAFIAASVRKLPPQKQLWCESRLLFADSPGDVESAATSSATAFVVPTTDAARQRARALREGSARILYPKGRTVGGRGHNDSAIRLGTIHRDACEKALHGMGLTPQESLRISNESKGRLSAVLWMVAQDLQRPPAWTAQSAGRTLLPMMLAGQWVPDEAGDRAILEKLSSKSYADLDANIIDWLAPLGPIVRRGASLDWLAWDFAWRCLPKLLTKNDIDNFRIAAVEVLATPDPKLELSIEKQWAPSIFGKRHPYSSSLRSGIVGSIVHFAVDISDAAGIGGQEIADVIVRKLLKVEPEVLLVRYLSLATWLPDLAEASPDQFLTAMEGFVASEHAKKLFQEYGIFGSSGHVHVLWALERLIWSKEFFSRAVLVLGQLAQIDPGGNLSNRPISSLTQVFLPWHPQTNANIQDRLHAIDLLYHQLPGVAWELAVKLLPTDHGVAMPSAEPQWRQWKPTDVKATVDDLWKFTGQLIDRMIEWAGSSGESWRPLVRSYMFLIRKAPPIAEKILRGLDAVVPDSIEHLGRLALSEELRELLSRHRAYSDTEWALTDEELAPVDKLYLKLRPQDIADQNLWLFVGWPTLRGEDELSFEERMERLASMRLEAVRSIWECGGQKAALDFADRVEAVEEVGRALATIGLGPSDEGDLLEATLSVEPQRDKVSLRLRTGIGYVSESFRRDGENWLARVLVNDHVKWEPLRYANLAWGLPTTSAIWDKLKTWGSETEALYWQRVPIPYLHQGGIDVERAVQELLRAGRPYRAISVAGMSVRVQRKKDRESLQLPATPQIVIQALEEALRQHLDEEWYAPPLRSLTSDIEQLLEALEQAGIENEKLATLEWIWMPALEHTKRGLRSLQYTLSETPEFFIDLLSLAFRGDNEPPREPTDEERGRAMQAYRLLHEWKRVPGTTQPTELGENYEGNIVFEQGTVDQGRLESWVEHARRLAKQRDRLGICDSKIGGVLAHSPQDPDGSWPCEAVRNLLEKIRSEELDHGVEIGVYNKRGVVFRGKGGDQERVLRDTFVRYSNMVRAKWPFTAAILARIAENYEREGKREDERTILEEFE